MIRTRGLAVLSLLVLLATGCNGFHNPAGLTRRGASVEVLSSCSDRGITELSVIEAFVPADPEPGQIAVSATVDPDADPVVLYSAAAPEGSEGVASLNLGESPQGWTTTGSPNAFGLSDRVIIDVVYGDAQGASTRLRLEQVAVGAVWVDELNISADEFAESIRDCDPGIEIDGRAKTLLTLAAIVAVLALLAAPLTFVWSLVNDRQ